MNSEERRQRLNGIFERLWADRDAIHDGALRFSWYTGWCYHPTYIRWDALLLVGQTSFDRVYVISPRDAKIHPISSAPGYRQNTMPHVTGGELIDVGQTSGPWLDAIDDAIPLMEEQIVRRSLLNWLEEVASSIREKRKRAARMSAAAACFA